MRKNLLMALLVLVLMASVFAGGEQDSAATQATGPVTIEFYTYSDGNDWNSTLVDVFNAGSDSVKVKPNYITPADYEAKLATILAGGLDMDAYCQKNPTDMFPQLANGYIEPLNDLIKSSGFDTGLIESWDDAIKVDGQYVAIPYRGGKIYTYYNKRLFDAKGVPYPTTLVEKGEWTWDKFYALSERLSEKNSKQFGGIMYVWPEFNVFPAIQAGVQFIDPEGNLDLGPEVLYSVKSQKAAEDARAIPRQIELKVTKTHYSTAMYEGMGAMLVMGEWIPGMFAKGFEDGLVKAFGPDEWGITRMPCNEAQYTSVGSPTFHHVASRSDNKEAAFQFISWFATVEGAAEVAKTGLMPALITDEVKELMSGHIPDAESMKYYFENIPVAPALYSPYGAQAKAVVAELAESYYVGNLSDKQFESELRKRLQEVVDTSN